MTEPGPTTSGSDGEPARRLLAEGELLVEGRLVDASNATLYCRLVGPEGEAACVYKPVAGERPLWDFPDGTLAGREVAAYVVSEALGWGVVPPTVLRDGPFGVGMAQLWVETTDEQLVDVVTRDHVPRGWLRVLDAEGARGEPVTLVHADDVRLRRMAVFDVVVNNADRKGGHVLPTAAGVVHGVDHGVTFHVEPKLRTVLWGWAGRALADDELAALTALADSLGPGCTVSDRLAALLTAAEVDAVRARAVRLLRRGRFPRPGPHWPAIPWPAF
jgi:uncharacterized repeat protein (TIGR03843 family)